MTDREKPSETGVAPVPQASATAPKKSYTLPARRLAGSPVCLNCGTELKGPFCYYCGQPDKNLMRFFPALLRDLLEDVIDLDSRFMRTLKPLLLHPGRLTRDYLDGRRFRYVPPLRLYIFTSMAFFILAAMLTGETIDISTGEPGKGIQIGWKSDDPEDEATREAEVAKGLEKAVELGALSSADAKEISARITNSGEEDAGEEVKGEVLPNEAAAGEDVPAEPVADEDTIIINDKPWDRETNPVLIPRVPDFINDWINDEIEESPQKAREIEANPGLIVEKVFDVLPIAVFVMLPLVALLFKFWYLFARKYYVEHLIHALHNHSFLFLIFILTLLADSIAGMLDPAETGTASTVASRLTIILVAWIPLYLLISLKTVYQQSWKMTLVKFSLIGISYVLLLSLVTSAAAITSFVLL